MDAPITGNAPDYVQMLNDWLTWLSPAEKQEMLDDFCESYGYEEMIVPPGTPEVPIPEPIPNPVTKKTFCNRWHATYTRGQIHSARNKRAKEAAQWTKFPIEEPA